MNRTMVVTAAIGMFCAAVPAPAQTAPAQDDAASDTDIVVTGRTKPPTRGEVFEQAQTLSRASRKYDENLARFQVPLCPGVIGFKPDPAGMIVDRIRSNAARVGVRLARAKCVPNLIVAVADDGRALLSGLERAQPQIFSLVAASERSELVRDDGPVRVWSNIATLRSDTGAPVARRNGAEELPSVWGQVNRWFLPFHRDIVSALVVFDRRAVIGMSLVQLADYASMRGLTHMRAANGDEPMATILALFAHGGAAELTSFDIGYLRSLYSERADVPAVTRLLGVRWYAAKAQREASRAAPVAPLQAPDDAATRRE